MYEIDAPSTSDATLPRRQFRFSLWALFGVMTLVCMLLATPVVMFCIFALVVAVELAALCFIAFIQTPVDRLMDRWDAAKRRRFAPRESDLAAMARDERFGERRTLFQPPSAMS